MPLKIIHATSHFHDRPGEKVKSKPGIKGKPKTKPKPETAHSAERWFDQL